MSAVNDTRVKPHVRAAAAEVEKSFGITNIGGFATSGHIPNSDHYTGHAIDVMTSIRGQEVANWAQANATRLNVKYIIWNRRIWTASKANQGWQPYSGTSPHTDHVHISFNPGPGEGGQPINSIGGLPGLPGLDDKPGCLQKFLDLFNPLK